MKPCAMYLRKSRADIELETIEKMETLARHKKILTELAKRQNLIVSDVYEEIVSGESIADRPQMQLLLDSVYQKKYAGVLVVEVERLARGDTRDQGEVAEAFKYSNTLIITPTKTYDPNNQFDEEYFEFGLFMSRREYKTIRRRLQTGIYEAVKEGNYIGSIAPYGYDKVQIDKRTKTLKPNEDARNVRMIYDWFVNDRLSPGAIARKLSFMGIPTLTGRSDWNRGTIADILQNIVYTGHIRWNRRKSSKEYNEGRILKTKRRLTPNNQLIVQGKHEAIIDIETFQKAQTLFAGTVPVNLHTKISNPLAGLLFCSHCGLAIKYQKYAKKENVKPRYYHQTGLSCNMKSVEANLVIDALSDALEHIVTAFKLELSNEEPDNDKNIIDSLEKELISSKARRDEIMEYFERKIYSLDEFLERRDKINERIKMIELQIKNEETKTASSIDIEKKIITLKEAISTLKNEEIEPKIKNDFLKEIISKIYIDVEDLGRKHGAIIHIDVHLL